jgi:hypothetical protein
MMGDGERGTKIYYQVFPAERMEIEKFIRR